METVHGSSRLRRMFLGRTERGELPGGRLFIAVTTILVAPAVIVTPALAQTTTGGTIVVAPDVLNGFATRTGSGNDILVSAPLNAEECATGSGTEVELVLTNVNASKSQLDFWVGTDCNDTAPRTTTTTTACTHLDLPSLDKTISGAMMDITFPAPEFCAELSEGMNTVYVLAADTSPATGDVGTDWGSLPVKIDTIAPAAPTDVTSGGGDTAAPVSWTASSDANVLRYDIYADATAPSCAETTFVEGEAPPAGLSPIKSTTTATSTTIDLQSLGLAPGDDVAIAVVAVDKADNPSVLSNTVCATRELTAGFCALRGGCPTSCAAAAPGLPANEGHGPLALVGLALAGWIVQRRRKR